MNNLLLSFFPSVFLPLCIQNIASGDAPRSSLCSALNLHGSLEGPTKVTKDWLRNLDRRGGGGFQEGVPLMFLPPCSVLSVKNVSVVEAGVSQKVHVKERE